MESLNYSQDDITAWLVDSSDYFNELSEIEALELEVSQELAKNN